MKRQIQDQSPGGSSSNLLGKKRNSSLFSIATANSTEDLIAQNKNSDGLPEHVCHSRASSAVGLDIFQEDENHSHPASAFGPSGSSRIMAEHKPSQPHTTSLLQPVATITPRTSCTASPLVAVMDDDQKTSTILKTATESTSPNCLQQDDFRCGLIFEAGYKHFDRHNRLHKERPIRVTSIMDALKNSCTDLYSRCRIIQDPESTDAAAFLNDENFLRVHLPGYMQRLDKLSACRCCVLSDIDNNELLDREAEQYKSIYFTPDSVLEAKKAASSVCSLAGEVLRGSLDFGFAVVRPPGHHAEPGVAGGYCIINNVAVAAAYAKAKWNVNKVLIVDWDCHFGNGTQTIFQNDPSVLYFSVHRWQGGNFFPFLPSGSPTNVGNGDGAGYSINIGWSRKGMGDDEYLAVWDHVLMPVAKEFQPDLILVSAGFDAALGDMGDCCVTPACFGRLTRKLMTLETPICLTLEGGYIRSVLGNCVENVMSSLLNRNSAEQSQKEDEDDCLDLGDNILMDIVDPVAAKDIITTIAAHRPYWKCFRDESNGPS